METQLGIIILLFISGGLCYPEEENPSDPELFQSDMRLSPMQRLLAEAGGDVSKAGLFESHTFASAKNPGMLWPREVPYTITNKLASNPKAVLGLMLAFREWESHTCLKFVKRTVQKDYIEFFMNCSGCWSYVGRRGGKQNICLSSGCWGKGTIIHEIAHAMGFWHEQSRPDRDDYIQVVWDNIPDGKKHNFRKHDNSVVDSLNTTYDYQSVMQYSKTAFGINGNVTMDPKQCGIFQLGQRVGFTQTDSKQAHMLYKCNGVTTRPKVLPQKFVIPGTKKCDFDEGFTFDCVLYQDENDDFDFTLRIGSTPSSYTGPEADHTTGRMGAYAYIEASHPRRNGEVARLITRKLRPKKEICLTFFYHMLAKSQNAMGTLNVYLEEEGSPRSLIFTQNKSQGNKWNRGAITLKPKKCFKVVFEAIRGRSYQGDISLDDVYFQDGTCPTIIPPVDPNPQVCSDVNDREAKHCAEWKSAGFCSMYQQDMEKFCRKTCSFCS